MLEILFVILGAVMYAAVFAGTVCAVYFLIKMAVKDAIIEANQVDEESASNNTK